jgi:hypothetical protein
MDNVFKVSITWLTLRLRCRKLPSSPTTVTILPNSRRPSWSSPPPRWPPSRCTGRSSTTGEDRKVSPWQGEFPWSHNDRWRGTWNILFWLFVIIFRHLPKTPPLTFYEKHLEKNILIINFISTWKGPSLGLKHIVQI